MPVRPASIANIARRMVVVVECASKKLRTVNLNNLSC